MTASHLMCPEFFWCCTFQRN